MDRRSRLPCCILLGAWAVGVGAWSASPAPPPGPRIAAEFKAGLDRRGIGAKYAAYEKYAASLFADSRGDKSFGDKTGNCRLAWVEQLVTRPIDAVDQADRFTRDLFAAASAADGWPRLLQLIADKLDAGKLADVAMPKERDSLGAVAHRVEQARQAVQEAEKPLSAAERTELRGLLYAQSTGELQLGHRFARPKQGRRTTDLLEKLDRRQLLAAAAALSTLADARLLDELVKLPALGQGAVPGVKGEVLRRVETPAGLIVVGGPGANEYHLDDIPNLCAVIDVGGDDTFVDGITTEKRPVLVLIDLAGNDTYRGSKPGIQGGAILGASLLVDRGGDDSYTAGDVAQGSALGGVGLLVDLAGNDRYRGDRRVQGQAVGGVGILLDRAGDDKYRGALLAQGVGGPLGFGMLVDAAGRDHYFAGGKYPGGYDDSPGFGGWSQGVGVGPRGVANGGIGVLLDGGGDDVYEADYFSHGGGYWFAVGLARDFGGNDQRLGATRENFDGSQRTVPRFLRWGVGYGCHYAAGLIFDDDGDDLYHADFAGVAFAWDIALAAICDLAGNDRYLVPGSGVAQAHNSAMAILYDRAGNDEYQGGVGTTEAKSEYHPRSDQMGGNFTLLLDEAGDDRYPQGLKNHGDIARGWAGGFLIDR